LLILHNLAQCTSLRNFVQFFATLWGTTQSCAALRNLLQQFASL
jgi:hypothetical protein